MAGQIANVVSIDALQQFRAALIKFSAELEAALMTLELESRRPLEWIEGDRSRYWPQQARRASENVSEARGALERCQVRITSEDARYCYDERKALEKAKRRLQLAEEKVQSLRHWRVEMRKAVEELQVQLARTKHYLDSDFTKAIAALDSMIAALDRYVHQTAPSNT